MPGFRKFGRWAANKVGLHTKGQVADATKAGMKSGFEKGKEHMGKNFGRLGKAEDAYAAAGHHASQKVGKTIAGAGETVGSAIQRGSKALAQTAQDNPGGLGVAAAGAGLGALALSKLLRRRKAGV